MTALNEFKKSIEQNVDNTLFKTLGIYVESYEPGSVTVALNADERHHQPLGFVHGGVYVLLAESAASIAAALAVDLNKYNILGMEINANHLRPIKTGIIRAIASLVYHGGTSIIVRIDVKDDNDNLLSVSRCTLLKKNKLPKT